MPLQVIATEGVLTASAEQEVFAKLTDGNAMTNAQLGEAVAKDYVRTTNFNWRKQS